MSSLFLIVCCASLVFFAVFFVQCSKPRARKSRRSNVRKVAPSAPVEVLAGRRFFVELEKDMAEFMLEHKGVSMLLFVLALSSSVLIAQDAGAPSLKPATEPQSQVASAQAPGPQEPASEPSASPAPLPAPAMTGPLQISNPISFEAGPLGKLNFDGIVSGWGLWQGNAVPGNNTAEGAISNGQFFLQKTSGWLQFYLQVGAYDILSVGTPFFTTQKVTNDLYGPVPVAYLKLAPAKNTSILIGSLPTLMGAEYTFDFENMNIERGLLWNQENAINKGIQLNQTLGKFSLSFSVNDGYYSNKYSWLSGALTYTNGPHSLSFIGMGNLSQTSFQNFATPVQNNSSMYALIYTYTKGSWIVQPYFQYSNVPTNRSIGVVQGASTRGGALLVTHTFKRGFALSGRGEYLSTTGSAAAQSVNLLYGPGSNAWSLTVTPTYQYKRFFTRAEFSFVQATDFTPGNAFGPAGLNANQPRGVAEVGFLF